MAGRYAHAKQFNRHRRELRILRTRLGRLIRDIRRKIAGQARSRRFRGAARAGHPDPLAAAAPARLELYSFHAPEVECIGKGKARALRVRRQGLDRHHQPAL